ncbi:MAG: hypothetical protein F6K09_23410 [Merismopedia sp. SIO2A8]|nr:hypothetical protein [Merismopedia sp. SIO2A8]
MEPSTLRMLWAVVEDMSSHDLLTLSDTALIATLMQSVSRRLSLSREEGCHLSVYIDQKRGLIRDMAAFRTSDLSLNRSARSIPSVINIAS